MQVGEWGSTPRALPQRVGLEYESSGLSDYWFLIFCLGRVRTSDFDCPICLDQVRLAVEFNCGHGFCGQCVIALISTNPILNSETDMSLEAVKLHFKRYSLVPFQGPNCSVCPYCRQRVTLILPHFSEAERGSGDPELSTSRNTILDKISDYNRKVSGKNDLKWNIIFHHQIYWDILGAPRSLSEQLRDLPVLATHLVRF